MPTETTERLGDKLDRELRCGDPAFEWGMDLSFKIPGMPHLLRGPMTTEGRRFWGVPCGQPLGDAQWIAWTEMGIRHAQCPHCGAVTLYALESDANAKHLLATLAHAGS